MMVLESGCSLNLCQIKPWKSIFSDYFLVRMFLKSMNCFNALLADEGEMFTS